MKRKYYIRGLGFGVLITSLVFIFLGQPKDISEEEIIRRAEALGYVKADTSADSDTEQNTTPSIDLDKLLNNMNSSTPAPTTGQVTETPLPTATSEPTPTPTPTAEPTVAPTPEPVTESIPVPTVAPSVTEQPDATLAPTESPATEITPEPTSAELPVLTATPTRVPGEVVTAEITVVAGVYSGEVCQLLQDAGIVEDGLDFRWYLAKNGFDREIVHGTYTLSSDMTYEELAKILTRTIHSNQNNQENLGSQETLDNQENPANPDGQNTTDTSENLEISNGQDISNN